MLPHRLKEARLEKGLSQQKLGVLAQIDEASASARMNQYERGIHVPDFELVCRLATVLDVPACYFYTTEDELARRVLAWHRQRKAQ